MEGKPHLELRAESREIRNAGILLAFVVKYGSVRQKWHLGWVQCTGRVTGNPTPYYGVKYRDISLIDLAPRDQ
jgi:hypothetical protein